MKAPRPAPLLNWPEIEPAKEKVVDLAQKYKTAVWRAHAAPFGKKRERQIALLDAHKNLLRAELELEKLQSR